METDQGSKGYMADGEVLRLLLGALEQASPQSRRKLVVTLATYFEIHDLIPEVNSVPKARPSASTWPTLSSSAEEDLQPASFSEDRALSPKEFMMLKKAQTDVERIACLAYYLTHYRDSAGFKTLDLSKLNAEAAQLKLSNAAQAVDNATKSGFLISHVKGQKRLSALGEIYVQALPDRAEARSAMSNAKPRRRKSKGRESGKS